MDNAFTTTAFELGGYRVKMNLGVVRGITVRSRSVIGNALGSFQTLLGGNITVFTNLCEKAREEAYENMKQHAEALGANAVLGVRYESNSIMDGVTEVLCYGTAVVLETA